MRNMNRVIRFEPEKQLIEVEAGIEWPELIDYTVRCSAQRLFAVGHLSETNRRRQIN
ncbi:MAG: hypothetical protein WKF84_22430 [Pyrinomonadaceae bacterium]